MKVLVTGAAGRIGAAFVRANTGRYDLRLADRREPRDPSAQVCGEWLIGDLSDMDFATTCVEGCAAVLHLAANPSPWAKFDQVLGSNLILTYNIFQAALEAGVHRVVFASTIQTVYGYPGGMTPPPEMAALPVNLYGASKAWGEALCSVYTSLGMSCCAVRIGGVVSRHHPAKPFSPRMLKELVYEDDLAELLRLALDAGDSVSAQVFYGFSYLPETECHLTNARELLGYKPRVAGEGASSGEENALPR